jgi:F-box domain
MIATVVVCGILVSSLINKFSQQVECTQTQPPGQRRRAKRTRPSTKASQKKRKANLSKLMLIMPMDVIYEVSTLSSSSRLLCPTGAAFQIFGHLNPTDLLNLARSSKGFRGILMSRKASTVWKTSRLHFSPLLPAPPVDVAEPRWANLWYGGSQCQVSNRLLLSFPFFCKYVMY